MDSQTVSTLGFSPLFSQEQLFLAFLLSFSLSSLRFSYSIPGYFCLDGSNNQLVVPIQCERGPCKALTGAKASGQGWKAGSLMCERVQWSGEPKEIGSFEGVDGIDVRDGARERNPRRIRRRQRSLVQLLGLVVRVGRKDGKMVDWTWHKANEMGKSAGRKRSMAMFKGNLEN